MHVLAYNLPKHIYLSMCSENMVMKYDFLKLQQNTYNSTTELYPHLNPQCPPPFQLFLSVQFSGIKYLCTIMKQSPPTISQNFIRTSHKNCIH